MAENSLRVAASLDLRPNDGQVCIVDGDVRNAAADAIREDAINLKPRATGRATKLRIDLSLNVLWGHLLRAIWRAFLEAYERATTRCLFKHLGDFTGNVLLGVLRRDL